MHTHTEEVYAAVRLLTAWCRSQAEQFPEMDAITATRRVGVYTVHITYYRLVYEHREVPYEKAHASFHFGNSKTGGYRILDLRDWAEMSPYEVSAALHCADPASPPTRLPGAVVRKEEVTYELEGNDPLAD